MNRGPVVLDATTLPSEPQPLPKSFEKFHLAMFAVRARHRKWNVDHVCVSSVPCHSAELKKGWQQQKNLRRRYPADLQVPISSC